MDSDEERSSSGGCRREHDMDQMRASSSSPSTISTASSGSPLVRGHSKGATSSAAAGGLKRPAPTSIAAAQLQCQQQRTTLKSAPTKSATSSIVNNGDGGGGGIVKPEKQPKQHEENKSFGYNVAKSIAYRAYRFNEFWALDKMSYLNLACLLMTLVCLITIVLFSTSNSGGANQQTSSPKFARAGQLSTRNLQSSETVAVPDQEAESIPEPSSQKDDSLFDDYASNGGSISRGNSPATDYPDEVSPWPLPRKSDSVAKLRRKSGPEREIEDSPPFSAAEQHNRPPKESEDQQQQTGGSLLEPILSQIFKDLELGSIFKAALNGTSKVMKPIIRRSKNGATIIISSSFNESSLANSSDTANPIPSLLQKLLPPMLFKQRSPINGPLGGKSVFGGGGDNLAGSATITISGRAIEPPMMAGQSPFSADFFPSFLASGPPAPRPFRAFFPEPMAIRMNSLVSAPSQFAALPYPSALGVMLRTMAADADEESLSPKIISNNNNNKVNSNETLSTQASQQTATALDSKSSDLQQANNKTQNTTAADPDVETFDVSQLDPFKLPPVHHHHHHHRSRFSLLSPSPAHQQSMMIFGTGSGSGASPDSLVSGPPMPFPMPMPHMMMLASGSVSDSGGSLVTPGSPSIWSSSSSGGPMPMPFNPILRAILGNLATGSSSAAGADSDEKNKTGGIDRSDQSATIRVIRPIFAPFDMIDSMSSSSSSSSQMDDADDRQALASEGMRQQMRARHRADSMLMDEMDSPPDNSGQPAMQDFMGINDQPFEQSPAAGVIRQTIRGPGMTMERIIELPSAAVQQVPRGVRSQSLSRLVEGLAGSSGGGDEPASKSSGRRNQIASSSSSSSTPIDRRDDGGNSLMMEGPMMPHRMSFIGKLLSDLSRRATGPRVLLSRSDLDDQMVDDSGEAKPDQWPPTWGPKIRVASARVRIRPTTSTPEAVFLSPIAQQQQQQLGNTEQQESLFETAGEPTKRVSLEDTLNSMEDRLDKVLSMASQYTSTPDNYRAIITPIEKPKPIDHEEQQQQQQPNLSSGQARSENPYTSPTSPLFGFPASSSSSMAIDSQVSGEDKKSSREPRSFTYHSNNELVSDIKQKLAAQRREQQEQRESELAEMRAESIGRASKFGPFFAPPAGAMGRRLDDGPFGDSSSSSSIEEQQQQEPAASNPMGPTFLEGRAMMPATGSYSKRPTEAAANNEATHFRTIVV